MLMHVALDDTDSLDGGCTTYITSLIVERLLSLGVSFEDFPIQYRCNPNIPFKTRGNAAQALHFKTKNKGQAVKARQAVIEIVSENSLSRDTAVVFLYGRVPSKLRAFSRSVLTEVVPVSRARKLAKEAGAKVFYPGKGKPKGVVGALGAIGEPLNKDYTFELISYRSPLKKDKQRLIDKDSVKRMDEKYYPRAFDNYHDGKIKVCPRGKDPVFCAVRANTATVALKAFNMLKPLEPVLFYALFRSNQKTEPHFPLRRVSEASKHRSLSLKGTVKEKPYYYGAMKGKRHVLFKLSDPTGTINCVAYERTRGFRKTVVALEKGDKVIVSGGVRPPEHGFPRALNMEKLETLKLVKVFSRENPVCPECGKRMHSLGRDKGYRCGCGHREKKAKKTLAEKQRTLEEGKTYLPHIDAQRHLTKPFERHGLENKGFTRPKNLNKIIFHSYKPLK